MGVCGGRGVDLRELAEVDTALGLFLIRCGNSSSEVRKGEDLRVAAVVGRVVELRGS